MFLRSVLLCYFLFNSMLFSYELYLRVMAKGFFYVFLAVFWDCFVEIMDDGF